MALADSTMGKLEELEMDVVAAQPDVDAVEGPGDDPANPVDFDDDSGHEDESDTHVASEADSDEFEDAAEEHAHDDQAEDTGQVFLGSGNRPWDRGDSEG